MAALAPLLHESDILRTKIWEAQRLETQGFKDVIEQLNDRLKMISKSLSDNATKQAELKANLTGLLMPKVAPRPPEAFTLEGKMVKVGEMPGSAQAEHVPTPIEDVKFDAIIKVIDNGGNDGKT